ncbi:hypothetical protein BX600DRAFT_470368 [Xylariales sp. PMI_506]|nr:hypothetical protein BX600DRAFT_470368 [Xylariales sp. PMI_506]
MILVVDSLAIVATSLGALVLARWSYSFISNIAFFFRRSGVKRYLQPRLRAKPGASEESWALITGSRAGIGRAYATELARLGFNIVLHGSNAAALQVAKEEMQAAFPTRSFRTIVLDACVAAQVSPAELTAKLDEVAESLQDIQLRILINNVGLPQARPEIRPSLDAIDTFTYDELHANASGTAIFPLLLTRAVYPQLALNEPSLIINMGSLAEKEFPLFPSYGPAKAFTVASARELRLETRVEGKQIEVLAIDVGPVTGTDTIKDEPNLMIVDATTFAKAAVRSIGCGYPLVAPYMPHAFVFWMLRNLPSWLRDRMAVSMMKAKRAEEAEGFKTRN